jgi:protoporphyrinogen/coproporphyrinogen III oxidase
MTDQSPETPSRRYAVIGGGVSGLAAAHRLIELCAESDVPAQVTLFEASGRVGGVAGTERIDGYLVETGADMFITNQPAALRLCERLGIANELLPTETTHRGSLVLRKGRPVRVPEGFMLLSPARIRPVLASPIFSLLGKLRMGLEFFVPRKRDDSEESLAAFVRRRFGKQALQRLIQPLVGGIYTGDPEKLSLQATMPRFLEMEHKHRSLIVASRKKAAIEASTGDAESRGSKASSDGGGARYSLFTAPRDGMSRLFDTLRDKVAESGRLMLNSPVSALSREADGRVAVHRTGSEPEVFDGVIVALPAHHAARLLSDDTRHLADVAEIAGLLSQIEYSSAAVVVSGHRLADVKHPLDAFGLVIPAIEQRRILAVSFTSRKFPGRAPEGRVLLRTFVGGALQADLLKDTDDGIIRLVREELSDILGISGEPDFARVCRYQNSMPQYNIGHLDRVNRISELMQSVPGIELAGNAYRGVGIPDCVTGAEAAAERLTRSFKSV